MKQTYYTAHDIERYHRGDLSAAEMHALEKAALDDPMLADALEGYQFTATPSTDLSVLQQKLQMRIKAEKKRRGIFYIGNNWMKVAALFILFATAGWLVFQTLSDKGAEVAIQKQPQKQNTISTPQSTGDSSSVVYYDALTKNTVAAEEKETGTDSVQANGRLNKSVTYKNLQIPPSTFSSPVADSINGTDADIVMLSRQRNKAFDSVYNQATSSAEADKEGFFSKKISARVPGIQTADTVKDLNIVLKPADVSMSEVVVKKREQSRSLSESKAKLKLTADTLQNTEDWDDYIASNMRKPDAVQRERKSGEVELLFDTNKKGEAINITVTKSLCDKCDEEAIRLLKEGPKWKKDKKNKKVKVKF